MRLLELTANKETFHPIVFRPIGVSIIAAIKETDDPRKTYNSVGKSLSVTIIHFCLGANANEEFRENLKEWEFKLKFQIGNKIHWVTREVSNPGYVKLDEESLTNERYKNFLVSEIFLIPEGSKFLSFRGLISRFIRQRKSSYISYDSYIAEESKNPIVQLINNAFLLGLDTACVLRKYELKESLDKVNDLKNNLNNPEFKSLFQSEKDEDLEISIVDLESTIERLKINTLNFRVADDYDQIRKEADEIVERLRTYKNEATKLSIAIGDIEKSLQLRPDISKEDIVRIYDEAKFELGDRIVKRLEDLESFNRKLFDNREKNLLAEKLRFEKELKSAETSIKQLGDQEDEKLQYLNSHGALDEFTKMTQLLADNEKRLERILNFKQLLSDYKNKVQELKKDFSDENIATNKYLADAEGIIKKNIILFKSFTERFYQGKLSGIAVENNEGVNKIRLDIKAKIEDDAGDAVNEVKMFCFDWTLLTAQYNHKVKFIFHDSRITDGMDTRQIKTMFQIAAEQCEKNDFQYIISLNQNIIDSLRDECSPDEFEELIQSNIVLRLSDKAPEDKLLGIQLDFDYER